jgi:hypothetical protein
MALLENKSPLWQLENTHKTDKIDPSLGEF